MFNACHPDPGVRTSTIFTILISLQSVTPGLVREQDAGLKAFLSHDGFSVLMRGMQSDNEKLRTKSAFLLLNLLTAHPEQKGRTPCVLYRLLFVF